MKRLSLAILLAGAGATPLGAQTVQRTQSTYLTGPVVSCIGTDGSAQRCVLQGSTLYDTTGTALGTSTNPLYVSGGGGGGGGGTVPTGTAGNPNAAVVTVQGISGGTPQNVNNAQVNGVTIATGSGVSNTGTQRVIMATDNVDAVNGTVASGGTDAGNPVKVGGVYNSTIPTLTTGQRGDVQLDSRAGLLAGIKDGNGTNIAVVRIPSDGSGTAIGLVTTSQNTVLGSTGWFRSLDISSPNGLTGIGVQATAIEPTSATAQGITPAVTTAVASAQVVKASAGNLFGLNVTVGATAGFVMLFNATAAPADGAVTPVRCIPVAANQGIELNWRPIPLVFSTGITAVFSSTGCFNKTASATAFISGDAK